MTSQILALGILFSCSDHQEQETAFVPEDDPQADVKPPIDDFFECPSEPVSLVNLEVFYDETEVVLNASSHRFGRVFRDYQGCFVRLSEPCTTQIGLQKPILRVECPAQMRDPIFTKCQGTIERVNDSVDSACICSATGRSILCPGEPDVITYGSIEIDGVLNPRSQRFGWIFVDDGKCLVNAPLETGQLPTARYHNWKLIACPSELILEDFEQCPKQFIRKSGETCVCEGLLDDNQGFHSEVIECPEL